MGSRIASNLRRPALDAALAMRGLSVAAIDAADADALLFAAPCPPVLTVARIRQRGWASPLMLLVEGAGQVVEALDAGADDAASIATPVEEVAARLSALSRRAKALRVGDLALDPPTRSAARRGRALALLPREYALLAYLARHAGRAVPRAELLREVWGLRFDPGTNVVQVHVSRLRARLEQAGEPPMLHTDRGQGYRLSAD